jgi:hypothetical protein
MNKHAQNWESANSANSDHSDHCDQSNDEILDAYDTQVILVNESEEFSADVMQQEEALMPQYTPTYENGNKDRRRRRREKRREKRKEVLQIQQTLAEKEYTTEPIAQMNNVHPAEIKSSDKQDDQSQTSSNLENSQVNSQVNWTLHL